MWQVQIYLKILSKLEDIIKGGIALKKGYIYSSILGGVFFAVPYLACGISAIPSVAIGLAAYGAGLLIFQDKQKIDISDNLE